jgi:hypothetical protein
VKTLVVAIVVACLGTASLAFGHGSSSKLPVSGQRYHAVTQSTLGSTVCVSGYTSTIRPPVSYTSSLKRWLLKDRNLPGTVSDFELDHAIPLELGGAPYSTDNLFMEAQPQATRTDSVENALHRRLCAGGVSLREAQRQILEFKRVNG